MKEVLLVVEGVPFQTFKEKIRITKEALRKRSKVVEIHKNIVYVERKVRAV